MTKVQVNIRIAQEDYDLIRAALCVRNLNAPQDLIVPLVEDLAKDLEANPRIAKVRDERVAERNEETGKQPG